MTNDTTPDDTPSNEQPETARKMKKNGEPKLAVGDATGEMEDSNGGLDTGGTATRVPDAEPPVTAPARRDEGRDDADRNADPTVRAPLIRDGR